MRPSLSPLLDAVAGIQGSGYLFRTLGGGSFGGKAFVFGLLGSLGRSLTGSTGRFFFGCAGGGLAGRSCFGGLLLVFVMMSAAAMPMLTASASYRGPAV